MDSWVYFIVCNDEYVKIGHSTNAEKRIESLKVGNPYSMRILAQIKEDSFFTEAYVQDIFKKEGFHYDREWFHYNKYVKILILKLLKFIDLEKRKDAITEIDNPPIKYPKDMVEYNKRYLNWDKEESGPIKMFVTRKDNIKKIKCRYKNEDNLCIRDSMEFCIYLDACGVEGFLNKAILGGIKMRGSI